MEDFKKIYCEYCGTQRCTGEGEWLEGCRYYQKYITDLQKINNSTNNQYKIGDTVKHKTKGCVETIINICKVKINGEWVDGVVYQGIDYKTKMPMVFVRTKEDFEDNFEIMISE